MYLDRGNGHIDVQGTICYYPPIPDDIDILNFGKPQKKQKWTRQELPSFKARDIEIWDGEEYSADHEFSWEEAVRQETIKITGCDPLDLDKSGKPRSVRGVDPNPYYSMDILDSVRKRELDRIFNGVWIYINGKPIYLTGLHYFYLNYYFLDGKYASFRWTDCEFFYVVDVVRHPDSPDLGVFYVTRRGSGKSYKSGAAVYHVAISRKYAHCGIQSKTDNDAETFFQTKILQPITKLPEFLIPINPHTGDITQIKKLEFSPPSRKNTNAILYNKIKKEALYTFIDFRNAGESAYDSTTLAIKIDDEIAKLDPKKVADAEKRLQTNTFCVLRGVEKKGFIIATSTIEEEMSGGKQAKNIWDKSNPYDRSGNGRTVSGLVRLFCSALDDSYFDEFGYPDREKSLKYHDAERKKLTASADLIGYKQKNPYTPEEAFWFGGNKCVYNAQILFDVKDRLVNSDRAFTRRGDIVWKVVDKEAEWVDNDKNGKWECSYFGFDPNKVKSHDGRIRKFQPEMGHIRVMAFDPYSNSDIVDENKGSNAAAVVYNKHDINASEDCCETIIADYLHRHDDPFKSYEDVICACFYFGCPVLIEKNKSNAIDYFRQRGYKWGHDSNSDDFVLNRPESTLTEYSSKITAGITSSAPMIEHYVNSTAKHINDHGHKLKHLRVIDDWLIFNPAKTKKYDMAVAASYAIVAAEKRITEGAKVIDIKEFFQTYDNKGSYSKAN